MHRRGMMQGILTALAGTLAAGQTANAQAVTDDRPKVAYHLCYLDKVAMALGNIRNHYQGMGGREAVTIQLIVLGPALKAFHARTARPDLVRDIAELRKFGLALSACANTMRSQNIMLEDLLPGFASAERGGVVELADLQRRGYAYIKP
jgi:intracellular sulfur oxidation DsrE/DsrF family protein